MAVSQEDVESWLPAEFLTEEELFMGKENLSSNGLMNTELKRPSLSFPTEFPYEVDYSFVSPSSALSSSPGADSVVGSTETEGSSSDGDDFLAGLTRRLAQQLAVKSEQKKWVMAGSPESTLSGIGIWSASSNGSPNCGLSPPATPFEANNDTWDLIYAAAGEVARLKMRTEVLQRAGSQQQGRGLLGASETRNPGTAAKIQNTGLFSSQSLGHSFSQMNQYQNQVNQDHVVRPQGTSIWGRQQPKAGWQSQALYTHQQQKQLQIQGRERSVVGHENLKSGRPVCFPHSAWPPTLQVQANQQRQCQHHHPLPQHCNSGMRAVFLSGTGAKRESTGTGVFLPRRYGNPTDSKKKSACSTVLLPAKVVQALNLNFDDVNMHQSHHAEPRFSNGFLPDYDLLMARKNAVLAQQQQWRSLRPEGGGALSNHDLRLPQEWTY